MPSSTDRIEKKVLLRAPLARVWRALADSAEFGAWFGMKLEGPFRQGATVRGRIVPTQADPAVARLQKDFEGVAVELVVERVDPERHFSFRWHPHAADPAVDYSQEPMTLVAFDLAPAPGGVLLTVSESGFDGIPLARRAKAFSSNEQGWGIVTGLLEKHLAHGA